MKITFGKGGVEEITLRAAYLWDETLKRKGFGFGNHFATFYALLSSEIVHNAGLIRHNAEVCIPSGCGPSK